MNRLLEASIFTGLPPWTSISYHGAVTPKLLRFEVSDGTALRPFYLASIVSSKEKLSWQSFQDLLAHAVSSAQAGMAGFYGLDVLSVDIRDGIRNFAVGDYARLLINHAKTLSPAEPSALIRYGQVFAILQKRAPADWGKVDLLTHIEIVNPEKTRRKTTLKTSPRFVRRRGPFTWSTTSVSLPFGAPMNPLSACRSRFTFVIPG